MTKEIGGVGPYLRKMREAQGKTLAEISEETKINCRYLEALEREAWEELPGEVFVRGYLRAFALALGLDPEDILRRYRESHPVEGENFWEARHPEGKSSAFPWRWAILISVVLILLLFFFLFR